MNVETITMDPEAARAKLKAYRAAKHKDAEAEYTACAAAYQELAAGHPLIDVPRAIHDAGRKEDGRPKLAMAQPQGEVTMATKDGGPAFPVLTYDRGAGGDIRPQPAVQAGMSLRDWFAGQALAGMLAADGNDPRWTGMDTGPEYQRGGGKWLDPAGVVRQAFEIADAAVAAQSTEPVVGDLLTRCAAAMRAACESTEREDDPANLPSDVLVELWACVSACEDAR